MKEMKMSVAGCSITVKLYTSPGVHPFARIESTLKERLLFSGDDIKKEISIAVIEDVIQAHAVQGIDVSSDAYANGIESVLYGL